MLRAVQTFWSAGKSLLTDSFGWNLPEYHLMSWALSCVTLKRYADEVVLYTDMEGKKILVEQLGLPYTDVVVYENITCPAKHWAYPKIVTYSLQKEPFLHVDGDVYLSKPLSLAICDAPLIAQNKEIGTGYYRRMVDFFLSNNVVLTDWLRSALQEVSLNSFNMGVFGGKDIGFIRQYCEESFHLLRDNNLLDLTHKGIQVSNNIVFEQILFAAFARQYKREITTVIDKAIHDNGYKFEEFCNLSQFEQRGYCHIIGGHKRNQHVCDLLEKKLLCYAPDFYFHIKSLFPFRHERFNINRKYSTRKMSVQFCIAQYQDFISDLNEHWNNIPKEELLELEHQSALFNFFMNATPQKRLSYAIKKHPYCEIFEIPKLWHPKAVDLLKAKFSLKNNKGHFDVALIPILSNNGIREVPINDLSYNILLSLSCVDSFAELLVTLNSCFTEEILQKSGLAYQLILREIEYLLFNGVISASVGTSTINKNIRKCQKRAKKKN